MRYYLKAIVITAISFYSAYNLVPTINVGNDQKNIFLVLTGLLATSLVIRPIFSLVLLPFNFLTFGLLSLILNIALISALPKFLPGFNITPYNFPGVDFQGIIIAPAALNQLETIIAIAVIITLVQKILHLIFE
jgi:uncharacterized membrane protein YvlD (DUF360 family)